MNHASVDSPVPEPALYGPDTGHEDHAHSPHLAHHFDTMEQQYDSGKLGMWVFLATELLMFGGLFCAYSVYRANHPEVFLYAHSYLSTMWGAINTTVLLASSLTMAWAVRCSQLNQQKALVALLLATLVGGAGFMCIKALEYNHKFEIDLGPGRYNQYNVDYKGNEEFPGMTNSEGMKALLEQEKAFAPHQLPIVAPASQPSRAGLYFDPNSTGADKALITPRYSADAALSESQIPQTSDHIGAKKPGPESESVDEEHDKGIQFVDMNSNLSRQRVNTFFGIYYCMTGLHGIHVIVGMSLIFWIMWRAATSAQRVWMPPLPVLAVGGYMIFIWAISHVTGFLYVGIPLLIVGLLWMVLRFVTAKRSGPVTEGEFSDAYFVPVDLVGLYWHLVDLIWIFLFPLLYLIHGKVGS